MSNLRDKIQHKLAVKSVDSFLLSSGLASPLEYFNREDFPELQDKLKEFIKIGAVPHDSLPISSSIDERERWFMKIIPKIKSDIILLNIDVFDEDACVWCKVKDFHGSKGLYEIWKASGFKSMSLYDQTSSFYFTIFSDESHEAYWSNV